MISSKELTYLKTFPFVALTPSRLISKEVVGLFLRTAEISAVHSRAKRSFLLLWAFIPFEVVLNMGVSETTRYLEL